MNTPLVPGGTVADRYRKGLVACAADPGYSEFPTEFLCEDAYGVSSPHPSTSCGLIGWSVRLVMFVCFRCQFVHFLSIRVSGDSVSEPFGPLWASFGNHSGAIWIPFGIIWEYFKKCGTILGATWIFIEFGMILGSIRAPLWPQFCTLGVICGGLVVKIGIVFIVMFFIWRRGRAVGKQMCFPHSKYGVRMRFRMSRNCVIFD